MSKFLITPSLYGSYLWYTDTDFNIYDDAEGAEKRAYQDFLNCLCKVKTPTTEAQQKGLDFEKAVEELTNGINRIEAINVETIANSNSDLPMCNHISENEYEAAKQVAEVLGNGGLWQQTLTKETDNYLLYGRSDYIRKDTIYDVKRTSSYEVGKYLKSIQHQIYFEGSGLNNFKYVIAAGATTPNVFVEYYQKEPNNLENLLGKIDLMVKFIKSVPEFYKPFVEKWTARGE